MNIAIDATENAVDFINSNNSFLFEALKLMVNEQPANQFILISNTKNDLQQLPNLIFENIKPKPAFFQKSWLTLKLSSILKKHKVDLLVSFNKSRLLFSSIPQCLIVTDTAKVKTSCLRKAKTIIVFSVFVKNMILKQLKKDTNKIEVVPAAIATQFGKIGVRRKNEVKEKYSDGKEFFLFVGAIQTEKELIFLLKSFSQFKKRQQSNLQLLIVGGKNQKFDKNLESYKYRKEVKWISDIDENELASITIAAYAALQPFGASYLPALQAMQSAVPVIAIAKSVVQEIAKEAALFIDAETSAALAEKMMLIYTNENLRMQLVEKGKIIAAEFNIEQTATQLAHSIIKAVN